MTPFHVPLLSLADFFAGVRTQVSRRLVPFCKKTKRELDFLYIIGYYINKRRKQWSMDKLYKQDC